MQHNPTVLVLDDDENIQLAFRDFLSGEHCDMIAASGTKEATLILSNGNIDLLITDIRLKTESGVTFFLYVKERWSDIPVIVITGFPDLITEDDLKIYGADYFFVKPLELDKLRDAVRKCLVHRRNISQ